MAIAFDAAADGLLSFTGSQTWSHTCTGSDLGLWVGLRCEATFDGTIAVTYNGVSLTRINFGIGSGDRYVYLFYLVNPATGTHTVSVTTAGSIVMGGSASYTGAAQTNPSNGNANTGSSGTFTCALTIATANAWLIGIVGNNRGAGTAGTGTVDRVELATGFSLVDSGGALSTGSHSLEVTGDSADWVMLVEELDEFSGGGGGQLFRDANLSGLQGGGPFFVNPLG